MPGTGRGKRIMVREAEQAIENMKFEIANELGLDYNGDKGELTSRQNGSVGGTITRRLVQQAQAAMAGKTVPPAPTVHP